MQLRRRHPHLALFIRLSSALLLPPSPSPSPSPSPPPVANIFITTRARDSVERRRARLSILNGKSRAAAAFGVLFEAGHGPAGQCRLQERVRVTGDSFGRELQFVSLTVKTGTGKGRLPMHTTSEISKLHRLIRTVHAGDLPKATGRLQVQQCPNRQPSTREGERANERRGGLNCR